MRDNRQLYLLNTYEYIHEYEGTNDAIIYTRIVSGLGLGVSFLPDRQIEFR